MSSTMSGLPVAPPEEISRTTSTACDPAGMITLSLAPRMSRSTTAENV
jgi:hypothetical protein